ncbi:hypothetical protein GCM10007242_44500 [Pigmentiphaga litoralis]|uniref:hypothetical protein n=1 Tax=Pigmentiphaga litoralis TaxID=516702 RepID=UPI00199C846A|nr:hypothetical protein [Pigmentiphaga litoralis]GGX32661.1 hypothetical protein GCM10007242_44500 [Pigmentiphaga litoralis]
MLPTLVKAPAGDDAARRVAVEIIDFLRCEYGSKFDQQWGNVDPAKLTEHWAQRLVGYTAGEVRRGIHACATRTFVPTLPEFLALCRPALAPEQAFYVAVEGLHARQRGEIGHWPHPAIYWAAVRIGQHDMLASGYSGLKGRWTNALQDVMGKGKWQDVPEPALALAAPGQSTTSDAEARQQLARLNAAVAGAVKPVPALAGGRDLRWAHRILEQDKQPTGRPPSISVQMAERALRAVGGIPNG